MNYIAEIRGALARGYCSKENEHKELDAELLEAIVPEVEKLLTEVDRRARESHGEMVAEYLRDWDVHAMDDREFRALVRHYIKNNLTPNQ